MIYEYALQLVRVTEHRAAGPWGIGKEPGKFQVLTNADITEYRSS